MSDSTGMPPLDEQVGGRREDMPPGGGEKNWARCGLGGKHDADLTVG